MSHQFKFSVHPVMCAQYLFSLLICLLICLLAYFRLNLLLTTPDNSISLGGSSYRESTVCLFFAMVSLILQDVCRCLGLISVSILFTMSYITSVITLIHIWETSKHNHAKICDSFSAQIHSTHKIHA